MRTWATKWTALALVILALSGCSCDDEEKTPAGNNTSNNAQNNQSNNANSDPMDTGDNNGDDDVVDEETSSEDVAEDVPRPDPGTPVAVDLTPYTGDAPNPAGAVRVYTAADEDELVSGEARLGKVGDYILENERVRFVIEADERVIGPCPYGGNIIDAGVRQPDGSASGDVVGEVCMLLNAGRTLKPERFEILNDGSNGEAGVLAVTGRLELLDFINLLGLAASFIPIEDFQFGINPDMPLTLTATIYYILRGGDQGVRVVTGLRNDGDAAQHFPIAHLMDSGGVVEFFNPSSSLKGFGYSGSLETVVTSGGEPMTVLGFRGEEGTHMVAFDPDPRLARSLPISGVYLAVSGVAVPVRGISNIATALLTQPAQIPTLPGLAHIEPAATEVFGYWHYAGDSSLATVMDPAWAAIGVETGEVEGTALDSGTPVPGLRVSAVSDGRTMNQAVTDANGRYRMRAPAGTYEIRVHGGGYVADPVNTNITVGGGALADLSVTEPGAVHVTVRTPAGAATPAKIVLFCEGECPQILTSQDRDVTFDPMVSGSTAIAFTGVSGEATFMAPAGNYRVAVSRGPEWSVWPPDAPDTNGSPVTVVAGETVEVEAEIAHVVQTPGWVSGDLHVHGINSPDSPVSKPDRVRTFLAEGVDVLVATDHDYITDYAPTIAELGATAEVATVIGEEITTFDYGHYNAFPMDRDATQRNGGAVDWAGGLDEGLTPAQIFAAVHAQGGDRVMQVNHPNSGYFKAFRIDTLRGTTTADPTRFRLPAVTPDPETGDTGMWDEGFTAVEIYNGYSQGKFWQIARWWLGAVSRGFSPTATAVSDTHRRIEDQAGGPRSYVQVGEDHDTPATFTPQVFAAAINGGRLIGTNGPIFTATARNANDETATIGDTLAVTAGQAVTFEVAFDLPEWASVTSIEVLSNLPLEALDHGNMDPPETPITPTMSVPVTLEEADLQEVATGTLTHRHRVKTVTFTMTFDADAYVVLLVRGEGSMFPILHSNTAPFAYTNPIFIDADGGGYNNPPLANVAQKSARVTPPPAPRRPDNPQPMRLHELEELLIQIERLHGH